ncbi:MAG: sugar ABC transporter permease [Clostridia bacterium]|nr:sugar ABC transporter permease [Clostridia bacterium]
MSRRHLSMRAKRSISGYLFILPFVIGFVAFMVSPLLMSLQMSFSKVNSETISSTGFHMVSYFGMTEGTTFLGVVNESGFIAAVIDLLGLDNYKYALTVDPKFNQYLLEEITKIGTHTIAIIVVSFVIAILLNQEFKGRAFVRAIFFLPVILSSGVLVNLETDNTLMQGMQDLISEQTPFTVTDSMMEILRLTGLGGNVLDVVFELIAEVYDIVMGSGIQIVVFLSGLQNVPASLYEAADVEGCTKWEAFWMITFPMVSPLLIVNIIYTIVDFYTKMSGDLSDLLDDALLNFNYDRVAAMNWIYFAITLVMIGLCSVILSKGVVSSDE